MTLPAFLFGLLCALLIGAIFHVIVDGGPGRLLLYMVISSIGFGLGQWLASAQGWEILPVGPLRLGPAVLGSLVLLLLGNWLSKVNVQPAGRNHRV